MVTKASFKYAIRGLKEVISSERNARIHLAFALIAVILSVLLKVSPTQFLFVVLAIVVVFSAEILNTAIEKTLDLVSQENNHLVQIIKDMTAAGVLVTALGAVIVALFVFVPPLWDLIISLKR